ncbi:peptide deformylase [Streptococcus urinalis FB127-CNA-2]|uniref:Peptide deformylase n=1 Tax=Streptococcus urinalis 2285-97 TaxID=764291 RepID=G5KFF5_9STRE|nr:peptide deformylase [Streptococcus urinalis]EHJ57085.1 peptide deformylase [Streptococcus urinalis 2285-97]EKS22056.1 peptide deformylase [Streptococcus urinalis FB127-CNA-2]VEF31868.1 peptide deformylase [Streptococcus urinalis]
MIKDIVKDKHFLSKASSNATKKDPYIADDLMDTLNYHKEECLGLAANMIGYSKRVIIVSMGFVDIVMFNPVIIEKSQPYLTNEGCLSLLGQRATQRYETIKVTYKDKNWKQKTLTLNKLAAQICQHELDHLEGRLI